MKYKVQCQVLLEYEVEAESEQQAEEIGLDKAIDACMYETDGIDFNVTVEQKDGDR